MTPASGIQELPGPLSRSFVSDANAPSAARGALKDLNGHIEEGLLERARIVVTELVAARTSEGWRRQGVTACVDLPTEF